MHIRPSSIRVLFLLSVLPVFVIVTVQSAPGLEVGESAPDFTLPSTMGGTVSLSQFRGQNHVLLEFYLSDFGPN